jgi:hypothetical protein
MAGYNCSGSANSAYGANAFGTCDTQSVGAPDTGVFTQLTNSGSFTIIVPLAAAIVVVVIATIVINLRKKKKSTDASL